MSHEDDKNWVEELEQLEAEAGPVLAYTPLMPTLEKGNCNAEQRRKIALSYLPTALCYALQEIECLKDIKSVAEKYPELIPDIISAAENLRTSKDFASWTKYESAEYKAFINALSSTRH